MGNKQSRLPVLLSIVAIVSVVVTFGRRPIALPTDGLVRGDYTKTLTLRRTVPLSVGQSPSTEAPFAARRWVPINPAAQEPRRPQAQHAVIPPRRQQTATAAVSPGQSNRIDPRRAVPRPRAHLVNSPLPLPFQMEPASNEPSPATGPQYHRIVEGDTLDGLAATYFGNADRFLEIFHANLGVLTRPDVLPLGVHIVIPPKDGGQEAPTGTRYPATEIPRAPPTSAERPAAVGTSSSRRMVPIGE